MNQLKTEAQKLRDAGYSYNMIYLKLGVSKGTLSNWFRDRPFAPNHEVLNRIQYGPIKSAEKKHNLKVKEIKDLLNVGIKQIGNLSKRDLWLLGLGIYIGEGTKSYDIIRVANADPMVIKIAIKWFKEIIGLSNENISIRLHLYPDNDEAVCIKFWQNITGLPSKSFYKVYIDQRNDKIKIKRKKLPFGTAHINIKASGNSAYGVKLSRRIAGWMHGAMSQV